MFADGTYDRSRRLYVVRLFAFEPGQELPTKRLHLVPVPTSVPRKMWLHTSLRIQHVGWTIDGRAARYEKYEEADPDLEFENDYTDVLKEPSRTAAWEPRPPGLPVLGLLPANHETLDELLEAPVVSAVVIAHDDEGSIARAVGAVVDQEVPVPFEVIVVTSGGDRTADVVRERFPHVTLVELTGTALPGKARNAGLRLARGEYVSFPGSHVELLPGSLAARVAAHDRGYAMVTGTTINGNATWAGTAAYFLENSSAIPGRPSAELEGPPVHCSYRRDVLASIGGFPEDMRAGEDTVVNRELWRRGHNAYRAQNVRIIHTSPSATSFSLARHQFTRGRSAGRIYLTQPGNAIRSRAFVWQILIRYVPNRLRNTRADVVAWGDDGTIGIYRLVRPLVAVGATAAWAGIWYELLRSLSRRPRRIRAG